MKDKIFVILLIIGIGLTLYPSVANFVNHRNQSYVIEGYEKTVASIDDSALESAREYNALLAEGIKDSKRYEKELDPSGLGVMGYIEIPKINVKLPIYHGTEDSVLRIGTGHIETTSLPIGGESTHSAIAGHTGLPSSKMFDNISKLENGDLFYISVLGHKLHYEVIKKKIVAPDDASDLVIQKNEDLFTLVTCTPYGVNDHRLLITGKRTEKEVIYEEGVDYVSLTLFVSAIILLVILVSLVRRILVMKEK